ncbi:PREDICTED: ubiquitin-conjugating enzyme E2 Q2-like [Colobus angolensis palliatus]|uniref:ubiquitin-conjugating enzyme E2 Q2-like n=1 Tax=Colobus angolensis palliatus TaxID=336983 RepID=UPI0005F44803|nr:PREDICTED: ubiquitin-conjugating enzyme E2 Q2-like [Colobus angolensis palliatus]
MQPLVLFERSFSTGLAACCCVLERRIVPWMRQESYSSSSPIRFVDSDEPNLTSVLECLEDTKNNNSNGTTEEVTSKEKEEEEMAEDIEDLDHYEMKEEPISGKKLEDEGIEKENWAILEKIRKTERYDHLNAAVSGSVQASDRFMKELRNIYRSQSYKTVLKAT